MLSTNSSIEQKLTFSEFTKNGVEVFVKRDDLIHPYISGNKWRKLKYNYDSFLKSGCRGIVTFGGAFSNHIIATSSFCAQMGIESFGIIRGEEPVNSNHMLILSQLWGMKLIFVTRESYRDKEQITEEWSKKGYFVIPEGGENNDGVKGCQEIVSELTQKYNHIICASGTGCTFAGIVREVDNRKLKTKCHSVPVLKQENLIERNVSKYQLGNIDYIIHNNYHFGGYAKYNSQLLKFIHNFASQTSILTDPIYTAKMFYALNDLMKLGYFKRGETVLAIHTGGLMGLLSDKILSDVHKTIKEKTLI